MSWKYDDAEDGSRMDGSVLSSEIVESNSIYVGLLNLIPHIVIIHVFENKTFLCRIMHVISFISQTVHISDHVFLSSRLMVFWVKLFIFIESKEDAEATTIKYYVNLWPWKKYFVL